MKKFGVVILTAVTLWTISSVYAEAVSPTPVSTPYAVVAPVVEATAVTLEQAVKHLITGNPANRLLSARTEDIEGRKVHVIKTLSPDGRIHQQTVAADSGVVLDSGDD